MSESEGAMPPEKFEKGLEVSAEGSNDPLIGTIFDKRYELVSFLGAGACGQIYKALDSLLQREVAIKIIHPNLIYSKEATERFRTEAITSSALNHPNIARVYNQGVAADGRLFMVMDCFQGEDLSELLAREGKLDIDQFFDLFEPVIDALIYAHEKGVVHRDLKPSNIVIVKDGTRKKPVVLDFGIAKLIDMDAKQDLTHTAALLGSSAYMSPEQCRGSKDIDSRSDVYSLSCVMLETLIGKPVFEGDSDLDLMYKHLNEFPASILKELPDALSRVLSKGLQIDPSLRYQTLSELKTEFDECMQMQDTLKRRWSKQQEEKSKASSVPIFLAASLLILCLALAWHQWRSKEENRKQFADINAGYKIKAAGALVDIPPVLPIHEEQIIKLATKVLWRRSNKEAILLLQRWLKERSSKALPEDRIAVENMLCSLYAQQLNVREAELHAKKVRESEFAPRFLPTAVVSLEEMYTKLGQPEKGVELGKEVLKKEPQLLDKPDAMMMIMAANGNSYMGLHDYENAVACLEKSLKLCKIFNQQPNSENNQTRLNLVLALILSGQKNKIGPILEECLQASRNSLADNPKALADFYFAAANVLRNAGEMDLAVTYLSKSKDEFVKFGDSTRITQVNMVLGQTYRSLQKYNEDRAIQDELLKSSGSWQTKVGAYIELAQVAGLEGKLSLEKDCLKRALDLLQLQFGNEKTEPISRFDLYVQTLENLRNITEDKAANIALYEKWIQLVLKKYPRSPLLLGLLLSKADYLSAAQDPTGAMDSVSKALEILSTKEEKESLSKHKIQVELILSDVYLMKSRVLHLQKSPEALPTVRKALRILAESKDKSYRSISVQVYLAEFLRDDGKIAEAEQCFKKVEDSWSSVFSSDWNPSSVEPLRRAAIFLISQKHYEHAHRLIERCMDGLRRCGTHADEPVFCFLYMEDGEALLGMQKLDLSWKALQNALAKCHKARLTGYPMSHTEFLLYSLAMRCKNYKEAERYMQEFIDCCQLPELAIGYQGLASAYDMDGKTELARITLEKGLDALKKSNANPEDICNFNRGLGHLYSAEHRSEKAQECYYAALKMAEALDKTPGHNLRDLNLGLTYLDLGNLANIQSRNEDAAKYYMKSAACFDSLGKNNIDDLKAALNNWATVLRADKKNSEAKKIEEKLKNLH